MIEEIPEDIPAFLMPGQEYGIGAFKFTESQILDFALQFDPQRFHVDKKQAQETVLGGLCASGWQTVSVWMKLQRHSNAEKTAELKAKNLAWPEYGPSPGMKHLKWLKPVYVDQSINYFNHVKDLRRSKSRDGWWLLQNHARGENETGERVIQFESSVFLRFHGLKV